MNRDNHIRVLGPVDVLTRSGVHSLGSANMRKLIGALAIGAGRAVPTDQLRAVLWGDSPPRSADNSLQTYVSRVRHLLGSDAVQSTDHSYRLAVERHQIDALRFEDLLIRATELRSEPDKCAPLCREALALWRGEPFGDLRDVEPFRLEAIRLEELRLAVMELDLECELALGRHEIIVAELESAVEEHPYRERLWYLLIEALLRDDRRVDAIRACHGLREVLAEVGLDAAEELRDLEEQILRSGTTSPDR